MTEDDREIHLPEALTHAAVPLADDSPAAATHNTSAIESGAIVSRMEELFPLVWLGMLTVVCVIGIYKIAEGGAPAEGLDDIANLFR